jgi:RNA polymerase sigma-70 factor (ECF subfamily)
METKNPPPPELAQARTRFLDLVAELRPQLHRYCARLTGSIVDGEDVVQETLAKAYYAISTAEMPPLHHVRVDRMARRQAVADPRFSVCPLHRR